MAGSYADSLIASMTPVGYDTQGQDTIPVTQTDVVGKAQADYKIPPIVWMFAFLLVGYFGLRMILED